MNEAIGDIDLPAAFEGLLRLDDERVAAQLRLPSLPLRRRSESSQRNGAPGAMRASVRRTYRSNAATVRGWRSAAAASAARSSRRQVHVFNI